MSRPMKLLLALAFFLPLGAAQAVDLDDLTMQVMESNDPSEMINDIELPDLHSEVRQERDHRDESRDDASHGADESRSEVESEVDDSRHEVEDSIDDSRDEADDVVDEIHDDVRDNVEEGADDAHS